jgi:histidine triad (HIT) family protein
MTDPCLFCKIAEHKIAAQVVSESADWIAFRDIHPQAPTHCLIIPKRHFANLGEAKPADHPVISAMLIELARLAGAWGIDGAGYRIVSNCNLNGGQTVGHLHFHLLGGRSLQWPPG